MTGLAITSNNPFASILQASRVQQEATTESHTGKWVRLHVLKLDAEGRPIKIMDPDTNKPTDKDRVFTYVANTETGELYVDDSKVEVMTKCALLITMGIPLYTIGQMVWNSVKTVVDVIVIAHKTFKQAAKDLLDGECSMAAKTLFDGFIQSIPSSIAENVWKVVQALEAAALYGLYDPYEGRALESRIERLWQGGASYKEDFRYTNTPETDRGCCAAFANDVQSAKAFYLAHCFQVRGQAQDTNSFRILKQEPVKSY
jgi:hypothetical protein